MEPGFIAALAAGVMAGNVLQGHYFKHMSWKESFWYGAFSAFITCILALIVSAFL